MKAVDINFVVKGDLLFDIVDIIYTRTIINKVEARWWNSILSKLYCIF